MGAHIRQEKAEEECTELTNKARTLEIDVDKFGEKLAQQVMAQEAKEAQVMAAEAEFNRLNRRVQELEEDLEITEAKYATAIQKYDKAATEADDSDRMAKVLANRAVDDEAKMKNLADELASAQKRAEVSEFKIIELEEELKVVANNLKSLEVSEDKANKREDFYKVEIKRLTAKLKQSETRSEFAERSVVKLQKEVDRLEDELVNEQDKFKAITEELDATFAEMSGY